MLESFSVCFTGSSIFGDSSPPKHTGDRSDPIPLDPRKREHRAIGLGLHSEEWDALFKDESEPMAPVHRRRGQVRKEQQRQLPEVDYTTAVRLAREAACPSRHNTPRKIDLLRRVRVPRVVGTEWMKVMVCGDIDGQHSMGVGRRDVVGENEKYGYLPAHLENVSTVTTAASTFEEETPREGGVEMFKEDKKVKDMRNRLFS